MHWLLTLPIDRRVFLLPADLLASALFVYLLLRRGRRALLLRCAAAVLGALVGLVVVWLVSDVWRSFGIALTAVVHLWVVLAFAGVFLAVVNLYSGRWWRRTVAIFSAIVFLIVAAAGINIDFGAYRNLNDALGITPYPSLAPAFLSSHGGMMDSRLGATWHSPERLPPHGIVGMVTIPAPLSHFSARRGVVYLPPAALVAHPPVLPVLVLLSGQPGSPIEMFTSAQVSETLDAYARKHGGLAPIVVAPDQLGTPLKNPMCADSRLGRAASYLTADVPEWIRNHLHVASSGRYWAVGGYSEGGTCAIQLGAGHPELFGSTIDVLGEMNPTIGSDTVSRAFGGDRSAYERITPGYLLAHNAPYADSVAIFGYGVKDQQYGAYVRGVRSAAARAGMKTQLLVSDHSGHDWNTVRYVFARALPGLCARLGLG